METVTQLVDVATAETGGRNTRYVARDAEGREYEADPEELEELEERVAADIAASRRRG